MSKTDLELLARYARDHAEDAFAEIVHRRLGLVFSAALRQVRSPQLAEEVAQSAFTELASSAAQLKPDTIVTAWLYQVTRRRAIDVVRRESRRRLREQIATEMNAMNATTDEWKQIEPLLDEAMHALDQTDRAAVLLRYFENKSLREVGEELGASEEAARKRVSRAVERLREFFTRRGVTVGASGLVVIISANAVQAAPTGLAATISTAVALAGIAIGTTATTAGTATKVIAMTTLQKTIIGAALTAAVGTGIYQAHRAGQIGATFRELERQVQPLEYEASQLRQERDELEARLQRAQAQMELSQRSTDELVRLRGEVARLRNDAQELARLKTQLAAILPVTLADRLALMKSNLEQRPEWRIPELQFADEKDWLAAAELVTTESEENVRKALSLLRTAAKLKFARELSLALRKYTAANNGDLPADLYQVKPFFNVSLDDSILQRWEIHVAGNTRDPGFNAAVTVVREKLEMLPDNVYDERVRVGLNGSTMEGSKSGPPRLKNYELD